MGSVEPAVLLPLMAVGTAAAGFYFSWVSGKVSALLDESAGYNAAIRAEYRGKLLRMTVLVGVLEALHLVVTVLLVIGAVDALASIDPDRDADVVKIFGVLAAVLALVYLVLISDALRRIVVRRRSVPKI